MRVLCLGNNTEDTDTRTKLLASNAGMPCYGLLSELEGVIDAPTADGYYHSSIYDIEYSRLLKLAKQFDQVVVLDQLVTEYSHPDSFYKTVQLAKQLSNAEFINPEQANSISVFEELVKTNKSFCIFPFIELLTDNGNTAVCCLSTEPITSIKSLKNYGTDPEYTQIRKKMLAGELLPKHCSYCYNLENMNIKSPRQQETVEWANRLNLTTVDDLKFINDPVYYEVRPSNTCNLQCRTCSPKFSHLIGREYKRIGLIESVVKKEYSDFSFINIKSLKKLYVAGGEPTAMPEFYAFLDQCIQNKQTSFEFVVNTNGTKLSERFKTQLKSFSNFQFIISIDGFGDLNHYIRWPSVWQTIVNNVKYLQQAGHTVSFNTTVSIYNIARLYELLEFFDKEFPKVLVHCQLAWDSKKLISGLNFPDQPLVLENLQKIQNLRCYKNDQLLTSFIDGLIDQYKHSTVDVAVLSEFFKFNDKLDESRQVHLRDYIPELERFRP